MPESTEALVLRSVNLPARMDDHLRGLAYALRCSKSDLIRHFVLQGLHNAYATIGERLDDNRRAELVEGMQAVEAAMPLGDVLPFEIGRSGAESSRQRQRGQMLAA